MAPIMGEMFENDYKLCSSLVLLDPKEKRGNGAEYARPNHMYRVVFAMRTRSTFCIVKLWRRMKFAMTMRAIVPGIRPLSFKIFTSNDDTPENEQYPQEIDIRANTVNEAPRYIYCRH